MKLCRRRSRETACGKTLFFVIWLHLSFNKSMGLIWLSNSASAQRYLEDIQRISVINNTMLASVCPTWAGVRSDRMFPTMATQRSHLTRLLSKFLLKLELADKHSTGGRIRTYIIHSSDSRCSRCDQSAGPKTVKQEQRAAGRNDTAVIVVEENCCFLLKHD